MHLWIFFLLLCFALGSSVFAQTNAAPTKFVVQVLEPTGGKIERPKEWFYGESHRGSSYVWTLSKEDASKGRYTTGVKIQTFVGVKEKSGKTPKQFTEEFYLKKKETAAKVVKSCSEEKQELFTRICLETEEGPYRIRYSLFWGNDDLDVAVVVIAGTTRDLWETYSPVFDKMSSFELIDMKRFDKSE